MPATVKNERWNLRAKVELPVALRDANGNVHLTRSLDLSASGIALRSPAHIPRGSEVYLVVGHASLDFSFEAAACVIRSRGDADGYFLALRFRSVSPEVAAEIGRRVIRQLAQESGATLERARENAGRSPGAKAESD